MSPSFFVSVGAVAESSWGGEVAVRGEVAVGEEVCARNGCSVRRVVSGGEVCARKGCFVRRVAGWDRPGVSRSVPERPGAARSVLEQPRASRRIHKKGPQARSPESILHFHQEKCISWNGAAGGAAVFLGQHLGYPFGLFFAKAYFEE